MFDFHRTFTPSRLAVPLVALAVYAVQAGDVTVSISTPTQLDFYLSSVPVNGTQPPFVFLSNTASFFMQLSYSAGAVLRAVTKASVTIGNATSVAMLGPAYIDDTAEMAIIRAPVPGFRNELVFTTLDTQPNADFVTVYDGVSGNLTSLLRVSGSPSALPNVTSTSDGSESNAQGYQGFAADVTFVQRVNRAGTINCTGACYAANTEWKW
jgi:hypothetical protein